MSYTAAVEEMAFVLERVAGLAEAREAGAAGALDADDTRAILSEAGRFAEDVLAPLNRVGDAHHAELREDGVVAAPGWRKAYAAWVEAGWSSLTGEEEWGGHALPMALQVAATDIWNQANAAFALNPILTVGAVEALQAHASDALKAIYLPKLVSGAWTGTMNLTEPQAGSDLAGIRTRAEPEGDHYRLFGQKIFISYGDHDLTDNIVHLVLARLPDAPAGTRGISLFLVPKYLVEADGSLGARNDVACVGVERKLGLHASPTCTMAFGAKGEGAIGYLVGVPHAGLRAMFTMMNNARVQVGMQGAAVAERATQQALAYAAERRQGHAGEVRDAPIILHPDVRRMLLTMKALTQAARAICYACAVAIDRGRPGMADAAFWKARADLLTPIAKAFATEVGIEVANLGIQVHGGMGYVEETGAAQHLRDARVFAIYEGTNGIQAIDLVRRKITLQDGAVLAAYLDELREVAAAARGTNAIRLTDVAARLDAAVGAVDAAAARIRHMLAEGHTERVLAAATPFLRAFAVTAGAAYLCKAAVQDEAASAEPRAALARLFSGELLSPMPIMLDAALEGGEEVLAAPLS
ncbi:acyl-CoA dehydrogenase family protein [Acuticoccus mangrovi]|uniref:3-methylmercaptopropionyl-CoA dehydrogenase n=1 Tax=Acuticoccus mangrovi TaxID=2796142 RepID=A0A934IMD7_9HYPH|nr:acyl-CoA dehydrogenase family protein [Acuticoccus mangrovi]MBJ3774892.1 acyl-CoA dehydrogenase family protein [Acuticoccus mangrovi]